MVRRVEILGFPACQLLDVTGPLQVFASANDQLRQAGQAAPYAPVVVAATTRLVTSSGLALEAEPLPAASISLDTLVVAGGWGVYDACKDTSLVRWIGHRAEQARRVASVCSGAFLLATTGLLDGRRAVTHWGRGAAVGGGVPKLPHAPDPRIKRDRRVWG